MEYGYTDYLVFHRNPWMARETLSPFFAQEGSRCSLTYSLILASSILTVSGFFDALQMIAEELSEQELFP